MKPAEKMPPEEDRERDIDAWIEQIGEEIHKAARSRMFGRMTLEVFNGQIVRLEVTRSIKRPAPSSSE